MRFTELAAEPIGYNNKLNSEIWHDGEVKPQVRAALLRIAKDFKKYIDVPFRVVDVIIAGGMANYSYTKHSDLDLHLIADFDSVDCDREAAELFDSKRLLYKREHSIKIHGIPVELYVEDQREPAVSSSYSLIKQQWIREPSKEIPRYDPEELEQQVRVWTKIIQQATKTGDLQILRTVLTLLRKYRRMGLNTDLGEFSVPNLVYKSLRNNSTLIGLVTLVDRLHDQQLSLT
jgi:hypothetical protein